MVSNKIKLLIFPAIILFGIIPFINLSILEFLNFGYINYIAGAILLIIFLKIWRHDSKWGERASAHAQARGLYK